MSTAHANPADLTLTTGIIAGMVQLAAEPDAPPPDWIKLTPKGQATTRDGRSFTFNPAALAARYRADGIDLAVDTDHSVALLASKGLAPNVLGYVKAAEARDDGTYGRVDWIDPAAARKQLRTHRYVSPTLLSDDAGNVTWLHSVSLVSAPALGNMPALASALGQGEDAAPASLAAIAGALGLPETADQVAILAAIGAVVPKATHEATVAAMTALSDKLATLTASTRRSDVEATVDKALHELKITPAQRDSYFAMCATEAGLANFKALMAATVPMFRPSGLDGKLPPGVNRPNNPRDLNAKANAYRENQRKAGFAVSHAEAVRFVAGE